MSKLKRRVRWEYEGFELNDEPISEEHIEVKQVATGYEVRYVVHDHCADEPETGGRFVHWKDHGQEEAIEYRRIRENPTEHVSAVAIDKYEHGGVAYSVAGEGEQCRWDTSKVWAYWVPDDDAPFASRVELLEMARVACKEYTAWMNGDVYGLMLQRFDKEKKSVPEGESVWLFYDVPNFNEI